VHKLTVAQMLHVTFYYVAVLTGGNFTFIEPCVVCDIPTVMRANIMHTVYVKVLI